MIGGARPGAGRKPVLSHKQLEQARVDIMERGIPAQKVSRYHGLSRSAMLYWKRKWAKEVSLETS